MVGDATNLIGSVLSRAVELASAKRPNLVQLLTPPLPSPPARSCILTRQLPFQRYLATYFVFVDCCLLSQYAYYSSMHPSPPLPPLPHPPTTPRLGEDPRRSYIRAARSETWAGTSGTPAGSGRHHKRASKSSTRRAGSRAGTGSRSASGTGTGDASDRDPMSASWVSETSGGSVARSPAQRQGALKGARKASSSARTDGVDSPEDATSPNMNYEARGRSLTRPPPPPMRMRPSLTQPQGHYFGDLDTIAGSPSSAAPAFPGYTHHRSLSHASALQVAFDPAVLIDGQGDDDDAQDDHARRHPSRSSSRMSRSGRAGERIPPPARRSTSMVFLSVGVLAGFGRWAGVGSPNGTVVARGQAWSTGIKEAPVVEASRREWQGVQHPALFSSRVAGRTSAPTNARLARRQTFPLNVSAPPARVLDAPPIADEPEHAPGNEPDDGDEPDEGDEPWAPHRNWERFIGRASAWLCTSLYLTSRLPQIWQNFRRRSVEGLAMMLFVMAFVGNSLYVASIVTNPLLRSPGYLLESTPYLLGSGGTLCFDITIVLQSYLYSPERRARKERARRRELAGKYGLGEEEEEALLRHADRDGDGDDATEGERTPRRSRSRSAHPSASGSGAHAHSHSHAHHPSRSRTTSRTGTAKSKSCSRSRGSSLARPEARELDEVARADVVDWGRLDVAVDEGSARDWSVSRPGEAHSRTSSSSGFIGSREATIAEEGESTVTLRG